MFNLNKYDWFGFFSIFPINNELLQLKTKKYFDNKKSFYKGNSLFKTTTRKYFYKGSDIEENNISKNSVLGKGKIKTKGYSFDNIKGINIYGSFNIKVSNKKENNLYITTSKNIHKYIDVFLDDNDIINIKVKGNIKISQNIEINLGILNKLEYLKLDGFGKIKLNNCISKKCNMDINGFYEIKIKSK